MRAAALDRLRWAMRAGSPPGAIRRSFASFSSSFANCVDDKLKQALQLYFDVTVYSLDTVISADHDLLRAGFFGQLRRWCWGGRAGSRLVLCCLIMGSHASCCSR